MDGLTVGHTHKRPWSSYCVSVSHSGPSFVQQLLDSAKLGQIEEGVVTAGPSSCNLNRRIRNSGPISLEMRYAEGTLLKRPARDAWRIFKRTHVLQKY